MRLLGSEARRHIAEVEMVDKDGNKVMARMGSKVDLLPVEMQNFDDDDKMGTFKYFAQQEYRENRQLFGEGPFVITELVEWPCGRVVVHFEIPKFDSYGGGPSTKFVVV